MKATTLTLALTALVALGADLARAEGIEPQLAMDDSNSTVFPAIYQEDEDSCFVQVSATAPAALSVQPGAAVYMDPAEYESLAYGCGEDDETITVLRGARMYAEIAR